ncbi:MAG TPA: hypothetical protein EYO33_19435 [Phycisphaerales bacterium]|nr:hypothetical protein [Phycisphaerales bacterium]
MKELKEPSVGEVVFQASEAGLELTATVSKRTDEGFFATLAVSQESGKVWESEDVNDPFDTFAFGVWFDGAGLPVLWRDIDGDGKIELIAPLPKGDLSPQLFRIYRWTGDDLLYLKKRCLIQSSSGNYVWSSRGGEFEEGSWVETFEDGKAEIVTLKDDDIKHHSSAYEGFEDGIKLV